MQHMEYHYIIIFTLIFLVINYSILILFNFILFGFDVV